MSTESFVVPDTDLIQAVADLIAARVELSGVVDDGYPLLGAIDGFLLSMFRPQFYCTGPS